MDKYASNIPNILLYLNKSQKGSLLLAMFPSDTMEVKKKSLKTFRSGLNNQHLMCCCSMEGSWGQNVFKLNA